MPQIFTSISHTFDSLLSHGVQGIDRLLAQQTHHVVITGLSRSGKTLFFTSLLSLLSERAHPENFQVDSLPLLHSLPKSRILAVEIKPLQEETCFPLEQSLAQLQEGQWPSSTDQIYGFELILTLQQTHPLKKLLRSSNQVVFRFYDYPGEWLTDLPMLQKNFLQWSDSAWSQQFNPPQKFYAQAWHHAVEQFDFDQPPNDLRIGQYLEHFRDYLQTAKALGITLLQPGSLLVPNPAFDWSQHGFAPLPSAISSDPLHPWTQKFALHFEQFKSQWLKPLQTHYFSKADKQLILLDLHEGLSHSRAHLMQLKETLSNLAGSFVYGTNKWYKPKILFGERISKVAFVATKSDLIPAAQHTNFMRLLQDITSGVRAHLTNAEVDFQHFLVSSIQVTDAGSCDNCLRFTDDDGVYQEWQLDPLPTNLSELGKHQNYPAIQARVPKDVLARMHYAQGIDRLMEYLIQTAD